MFFKSKPIIYLQLCDQSVSYLVTNEKDKKVTEQGELVFDNHILNDGEIINEPLLSSRLDVLVKEKKWKNAKVHILLPNKFIVLRKEWIPAQLVRDEITDYLQLHIGQSIHLPIENPIFEYEVIERNEEQQKVLIVAYPLDKVQEYKRLIEKVSLTPAVADFNTFGFYRIAEREAMINENKHTLMIEWNPYDIALMVYHQNQPKFFRQNQFPEMMEGWEQTSQGEWRWEKTQEELDQSLLNKTDELERMVNFYNYSVLHGKDNIQEIILTGYYPDLVSIKKLLTSHFAVDVSILNLPLELNQKYAALYGLTLKAEKTNKKRKKGVR